MKNIILLIVLTIGALQGDDSVHYDIKEVTTPINKPNHPTNEIY